MRPYKKYGMVFSLIAVSVFFLSVASHGGIGTSPGELVPCGIATSPAVIAPCYDSIPPLYTASLPSKGRGGLWPPVWLDFHALYPPMWPYYPEGKSDSTTSAPSDSGQSEPVQLLTVRQVLPII
ncbi:MAG: hypothetical protein AB1847_13200 [bacterium]